MKHLYLFALFFTFSNFLYAQLDTNFQQTKVVEAVFENQQMVDAKSYMLNSLMDEKNIFRLGFEGISLPASNTQGYFSNLPLANSLFLAYEHRIKTGFSINAQIHYNQATSGATSQPLNLWWRPRTHSYGFHIEPRWYIRKQKQVYNKKSGNNLSGLYASLLAGVRYVHVPINPRFFSSDGQKQFFKSQYQYSTVNLGWQRRFSKSGFVHLQLGAGIQHNPQKIIRKTTSNGNFELEPLPKWRWISTYSVGIGLALNKRDNSTIEKNIWAYYKADTDMWKVDLFEFLQSISKGGIGGKINIGYERSIKQSAFSIASNLILIQQVYSEQQIKFHQISFQIAPRFYYNLKNRIRKGKTANDLSAEYFSLRNQWTFNRIKKYDFSILWGIQRRVFENMFINYELGYDFPSNSFALYEEERIISELKIGLAF